MPLILASNKTRRFWIPPTPPPVVTSPWPVHAPAYLSAVPGHSGYGLDTTHGTGRHLGTPLTNVYLWDDLADSNTVSERPELGERTWSGTYEGCWRAFQDAGAPPAVGKIMMPITSGWSRSDASIPGQQGTPPVSGYWWYAGQTAPSPGVFLRGTRASINGASNVLIQHLRSYMGDDAGGLGADNRDCMNSGAGGITCSYVIFMNNDGGFTVDETLDNYRAHTALSWLYNILTDPLHDSTVEHPGDPTDTDHGFHALAGGDTIQPGTFSMFRNVFAHGTGRAPATTATAFCAANNLYYNQGGRPGGGNGEAIDVWSQNTTTAMIANVLYNWFIRGPEHTSTVVAVRTRSGAPSGSIGYLEGNAAHGWTVANQAALLNNGVTNWLQGSLTSAIPSSWGGLPGVLLETPSSASDWHAIIDLMDDSCGAQPAFRSASYGRIAGLFDQMRARIDGGSTSFQFINTVAGAAPGGAGGWWTVPVRMINPADPGADWDGEPMPLGTDRNDILGTGTFANGLSMAGRTKIEAWLWRRHYGVGGK